MFDLVIRNATLVDGTGSDPQSGVDIGVVGELITEVGVGIGSGTKEIDAAGLLVTPGFVDIHSSN